MSFAVAHDSQHELEIAVANSNVLSANDVMAVVLTGSLGSGKTSLIEASIRQLGSDAQIAVIAFGCNAHLDIERVRRLGCQGFEATGFDSPVLAPSASLVHEAIQTFDLRHVGLVFIETEYSWNSAAPLYVGQDLSVAVYRPAGDRPQISANEVVPSDVAIVNRNYSPDANIDLLSSYCDELRRLNPYCELLQLSLSQGQGLIHWSNWLLARLKKPLYQQSHWFG